MAVPSQRNANDAASRIGMRLATVAAAADIAATSRRRPASNRPSIERGATCVAAASWDAPMATSATPPDTGRAEYNVSAAVAERASAQIHRVGQRAARAAGSSDHAAPARSEPTATE